MDDERRPLPSESLVVLPPAGALPLELLALQPLVLPLPDREKRVGLVPLEPRDVMEGDVLVPEQVEVRLRAVPPVEHDGHRDVLARYPLDPLPEAAHHHGELLGVRGVPRIRLGEQGHREVGRHHHRQADGPQVVPLRLVVPPPREGARVARVDEGEEVRRVVDDVAGSDPVCLEDGGEDVLLNVPQRTLRYVRVVPEVLRGEQARGEARRKRQRRMGVPVPYGRRGDRRHGPVDRLRDDVLPDGRPLRALRAVPVDGSRDVEAPCDVPDDHDVPEILHVGEKRLLLERCGRVRGEHEDPLR